MKIRALSFFALLPLFAQVNVLTQRNDNQRSGLNLQETALNPVSVKTKFHKLWALYSDAKIMAQPLYVSNLKSAKCPGGCNTVIFCSMKGTVYAYMADQQPTNVNDTLVWARYLGDPRPGDKDIDMWSTDDPWWGILGTPVIDLQKGLIYLVAWNPDQNYRLYGLDLASGNVTKGAVVIQGSVGGLNFTGTGNWVQHRKQRAGLLLVNGTLYVCFGGDNPNALAGWMFAYDANTLALQTIWSPTPGGRNGGIWQSGQGPAADQQGLIYLQTGDGDVNIPAARYGDSLVKLKMEHSGGNSTLTVADHFTPCDQMFLARCDLDMGSAGPLLFGGNFILGGGKRGMLYLMDRTKLGGYTPGPFPPNNVNCGFIPDCTDSPSVLQKVNSGHGHVHGTPVFWSGPGGKAWIYAMPEGFPLQAIPFENNRLSDAKRLRGGWSPANPTGVECWAPVEHWMPGGILTVSSDGATPNTGIVWAVVPANGDANSYRGVKGMLVAVSAEDVRKELWRSQAANGADTADSFGLLSRFVPPTVANGKVFIATAGDREPLHRYCPPQAPTQFPANYSLAVYGLR
ncbi:MAG: hypothetical protein M3Y27_04345 [Acidobacteriota bacterium]|nr:hypothetical protein [Acidobacteriota bacterium]